MTVEKDTTGIVILKCKYVQGRAQGIFYENDPQTRTETYTPLVDGRAHGRMERRIN